MRTLSIFILILIASAALYGQNYLSNLNHTGDMPVYSMYAASMERSEYVIDQAYQFMWFNPKKDICLETDQAGNWGLLWNMNGDARYRLEQYWKEPVVTASYSDLVTYTYYPYKNIKVDVFFLVYSSRLAVQRVTVTNEGAVAKTISAFPYLQYDKRGYREIQKAGNNGVTFMHTEKPDGWMEHHEIPFLENVLNAFVTDFGSVTTAAYDIFEKKRDTSLTVFINEVKNDKLTNGLSNEANIISLQSEFTLQPGAQHTFSVVKGVSEPERGTAELLNDCNMLLKEDLNTYLDEAEDRYEDIPVLSMPEKYNDLYWNAFSLVRQCMMPPEGECSYNYYIFSREPRWGWGYGGQVFHESLVMLAYAYMDPVSAMNSQRVFMERQWENGYINYRTGPYLNESIPVEGQFTSSAPWFNWINYEVYKITQDNAFLKEAYESGKRYYEYYIANRDSDNDGLCEWGAHAVLESVRDARVVIWDEVADPVNYEAVDLNIMLYNEAISLAAMAQLLDLPEEKAKWLADAENRKNLINKYNWDPETKFYYQVDKDSHTFTFENENDLKRQEIIAFLALWAGVANEEQAAALVEHMTNPETFWRNYGIPTLSAADSYYSPLGYWNGPIWVQWQYLIFRGLIKYGYDELAKELMDKVLDNIEYQLKTNHWFWEFYSADDYQAGYHKTYVWTGIYARMLIDLYGDAAETNRNTD